MMIKKIAYMVLFRENDLQYILALKSWFHGRFATWNSVHHNVHTMERWKIYSHQKIFRQIYSLVIYSVTMSGKALISKHRVEKYYK